jgi:short-subunit dehydrogenase
MVTGVTSGLGEGLAHDLAKRHAILHLVCRNKERGEKLRKELIDTTKN